MKIAISVGDLNGVGVEIALKSHQIISEICHPIYMIDESMLQRSAKLLDLVIPEDFECYKTSYDFKITPSQATKESGRYSYDSFLKAINLADTKKLKAIVTLPINKHSWELAGIKHKGHTDMLADIYQKEAIMMIGCDKLFTALFTHHIPLKEVSSKIQTKPLTDFLLTLYSEIKEDKIGVLGLNPHAGDSGVIGDEEKFIQKAIDEANSTLLDEIFIGPLVPDTAFTPHMRDKINHFVCMYHDQGLIATKALYFDESINVSLNLPIIRTSVDHGTAYDIAYKDKNPSTLSYLNAVKEAVRLVRKREKFKI
jgi:4-hydroxythreonine-4-phosphate dehydrogenase